MIFFKDAIEILFSISLFINALLFIPQAIKIIKEKSAVGVSSLTFIGFLFIQLTIVLHGIINQDYILIIGYILSMITCGTVILLILTYRRYDKYVAKDIIPLEQIISQSPGHIYWKNKDGVYLGCSNLQAKDAGFLNSQQMIGKTDYDFPWKNQADFLRKIDLEVIQTATSKTVEEPSILADGTASLFLSKKVPLYHRGKIEGVLGISFDITQAKKEITERLSIFETIIALMPGHVYWIDRSGVYLGCNDNQAKSAGLNSRKEIIGKHNKDLPWNYNAGLLPEALDKVNEEVMQSGKTIVLEEPATLIDGNKAIFLSSKVPLYNTEGKITGMVGISIDITEIRKTEKKLLETEHRLNGMTLVSASTAHELHTPLASINLSTQNLRDVLPHLIVGYKLAEQANLPVKKIRSTHLKIIEDHLNSIENETRAAFTFIDMLLMNLNPSLNKSSIETFSMVECVQEALHRYPFREKEKSLIQFNSEHDFSIHGNKNLLVHVFFNLFKNALHYLAKSRKKEASLSIWLNSTPKENQLFFKDNGTGITADVLPHIFERFFSQTLHGFGVGLTFCKMVMGSHGGDITCESIENVYTQFTLVFPRIEPKESV